jgi:hypothetical protein
MARLPEYPTPERYEDTTNPKNPPQSVTNIHVRSAALPRFLGAIVVLFVLAGVVFVFWTASHPRPAVGEEAARVVGTSGYYSTEGGHDPVRKPGSTRAELKFRGSLTPPSEAQGR